MLGLFQGDAIQLHSGIGQASLAVRQVRGIAVEDGVVVCPAHLLEKELESPLAHVLALVFVLAEPRKRELAHARPDATHERLQVRRVGAAMHLAPCNRVTCALLPCVMCTATV